MRRKEIVSIVAIFGLLVVAMVFRLDSSSGFFKADTIVETTASKGVTPYPKCPPDC